LVGLLPRQAIPSARDPLTVASGLAFGKIYDLVFAKTFGGTFGDVKTGAQV